jgi:hypothetical protein
MESPSLLPPTAKNKVNKTIAALKAIVIQRSSLRRCRESRSISSDSGKLLELAAKGGDLRSERIVGDLPLNLRHNQRAVTCQNICDRRPIHFRFPLNPGAQLLAQALNLPRLALHKRHKVKLGMRLATRQLRYRHALADPVGVV